jgi:hypothetical protein
MTNNKQQTAVEWFAKKVMHLDWKFSNQKEKEKIIQQAKEMEKKQIINAFSNGDNTDCTSEQNIKDFAQQYYNKTYGGNK